MNPLSFTVTPGAASQAYQTASGLPGAGGAAGGAAGAPDSFGDMLGRAVGGAIETGQQADALATAGIEGHASVTDVVTALSKAELALQTTATLRDRMVQAYQEIMRMPI